MPTFSAESFFNGDLADGATSVDVVVTVKALKGEIASAPVVAAVAERLEIIVVDVSGSMDQPSTKIRAARKATAAAVDLLADGTKFAIVAGEDNATIVYPRDGNVAIASERTRAEAKQVAEGLTAANGTNIPGWLTRVRMIASAMPNAIRHCLLLTDGDIQPASLKANLPGAVAALKGLVQVDCFGVGTDWKESELLTISNALMGETKVIADPAKMVADFKAIIEVAQSKTIIPEISVWAPSGSTLEFVKEAFPNTRVLSADPSKAPNPLTQVFQLGAFADGDSRDYHIRIKLGAPGGLGELKAAGRIKVVVDGNVVSEQLIRVQWTDDLAKSTRIVKEVAHYTGQAELAQAIQDGLEARAKGDEATATVRLGRAAQLAHESGNAEMTARLKKVVEIDNPETGTVRLKRDVAKEDAMDLNVSSTRTVRNKKA